MYPVVLLQGDLSGDWADELNFSPYTIAYTCMYLCAGDSACELGCFLICMLCVLSVIYFVAVVCSRTWVAEDLITRVHCNFY